MSAVFEFSVAAFRQTRQAHDAAPRCPACGWLPSSASHIHVSIKYSTVTRLGDGVEVSRFGEKVDPYLDVSCNVCGFEWEMEVAFP